MSDSGGGGGGAGETPPEGDSPPGRAVGNGLGQEGGPGAGLPPLPASLLGGTSPLSAALGELAGGEEDMGRLQAMLEARGFPPHLAGSSTTPLYHITKIKTIRITS